METALIKDDDDLYNTVTNSLIFKLLLDTSAALTLSPLELWDKIFLSSGKALLISML